jgi:hypothetical protein
LLSTATPAPGQSPEPEQQFASPVTVFTCYVWTPPLSGFLFIPSQITLRAVISESLQRQQ